MRTKVYRNFGAIRVFSGSEVKIIRPEQGLRINPTTGEVILDDEGNAESEESLSVYCVQERQEVKRARHVKS